MKVPKENANHEFREILGWCEFACWTMVAMGPLLYWINGPAVSTEQLAIRTALVVLALVAGVSFRVSSLLREK